MNIYKASQLDTLISNFKILKQKKMKKNNSNSQFQIIQIIKMLKPILIQIMHIQPPIEARL